MPPGTFFDLATIHILIVNILKSHEFRHRSRNVAMLNRIGFNYQSEERRERCFAEEGIKRVLFAKNWNMHARL